MPLNCWYDLLFGTKNRRRLHGQREFIREAERKKDINIIRGQRAWSWLKDRRGNNEKIGNEETNNDAQGQFLQRIPTTDADNQIISLVHLPRHCIVVVRQKLLIRFKHTGAILFSTLANLTTVIRTFVRSMDASRLDMCYDKLEMKRFSTG